MISVLRRVIIVLHDLQEETQEQYRKSISSICAPDFDGCAMLSVRLVVVAT